MWLNIAADGVTKNAPAKGNRVHIEGDSPMEEPHIRISTGS